MLWDFLARFAFGVVGLFERELGHRVALEALAAQQGTAYYLLGGVRLHSTSIVRSGLTIWEVTDTGLFVPREGGGVGKGGALWAAQRGRRLRMIGRHGERHVGRRRGRGALTAERLRTALVPTRLMPTTAGGKEEVGAAGALADYGEVLGHVGQQGEGSAVGRQRVGCVGRRGVGRVGHHGEALSQVGQQGEGRVGSQGVGFVGHLEEVDVGGEGAIADPVAVAVLQGGGGEAGGAGVLTDHGAVAVLHSGGGAAAGLGADEGEEIGVQVPMLTMSLVPLSSGSGKLAVARAASEQPAGVSQSCISPMCVCISAGAAAADECPESTLEM